jgi:transposase
MESGNLEGLRAEIEKAKRRLGLEESAVVRSCYEAGREGFWLHRALEQMGIENIIVDASSIEVNRRGSGERRRTGWMRRSWYGNWCDIGEGNATCGVWVRVPSPEDEDRRQLHRGLEVLKEERKQHRVRIQSLLFTQGIDVKVGPKFLANLEALRCWNKQPVAEQMRQRIQDEVHRLQLVEVQIRELKVQQAEQVRAAHQDAVQDKVRRLQQLMGVGLSSSWIFLMELFGWGRSFRTGGNWPQPWA